MPVTRKSISRLARKYALKVGALAYTASRARPSGYVAKRTYLRMSGKRWVGAQKRRKVGKSTSYSKTKTARKIKSTANKYPNVKKNFRDKVQKVISFNNGWGVYSYCSDLQVRQTTRDQWAYYDADQNGVPLELFTPRRIWDAASICFNNKPAAPFGMDVDALSYNPSMKLSLIDCYFTMFFKSTSNHVVTIEIGILKPKKLDPTQDPIASLTFSTDDYDNPAGATLYTNPSFRLEYATNTHTHYSMEVMKFKLIPGESTYRRIQGPKNLMLDGTSMLSELGTSVDIATFNRFARFSRTLFIRVINDVTVSTVPGSCGAFPSSSIGGVACRMEQCIKVGDPRVPGSGALDDGRNSIATGKFYLTEGLDQQVVVNNPINAVPLPF